MKGGICRHSGSRCKPRRWKCAPTADWVKKKKRQGLLDVFQRYSTYLQTVEVRKDKSPDLHISLSRLMAAEIQILIISLNPITYLLCISRAFSSISLLHLTVSEWVEWLFCWHVEHSMHAQSTSMNAHSRYLISPLCYCRYIQVCLQWLSVVRVASIWELTCHTKTSCSLRLPVDTQPCVTLALGKKKKRKRKREKKNGFMK